MIHMGSKEEAASVVLCSDILLEGLLPAGSWRNKSVYAMYYSTSDLPCCFSIVLESNASVYYSES